MVIYEITAVVVPSFVVQYEQYMFTRHIPNLLATGHFTGASFVRSRQGRHRVRYGAATREALDRYLSEHAPRLRADFAAYFPTGVQLRQTSLLTQGQAIVRHAISPNLLAGEGAPAPPKQAPPH